MGGRLVPDGYLQLVPWWRNLFEHIPAVQFNHRLLGIATVVGALALWWLVRNAPVSRATARLAALGALVATLQMTLGIATLLLAVPVSLGVLHQAGAVALLTVAVLLVHSLRPAPVASPVGSPALATSV